MADDADRAQAQTERMLEAQVRAARGIVPTGAPGTCDGCGDFSQRIVGGHCAPCREPVRAPRRW